MKPIDPPEDADLEQAAESGFRYHYPEFALGVSLLKPLSVFESSAAAREMAKKLPREHLDLKGLDVTGGRICGAPTGLRASEGPGGS